MGPRHAGKKTVAHDRVEPAPQIGTRLPLMRIGEGLHDGVLDEILGVGLLAVPAAHDAAQKWDFVFYALREVPIRGPGAMRLRVVFFVIACRRFAAEIGLNHSLGTPAADVQLFPRVSETERVIGRIPDGALT